MRALEFTHGDRSFVVDRGVFDPVRHLSGLAFAEHLVDALAPVVTSGSRVVDVGTGCGLLAATAAQAGYRVVATDLSPAAVACARRNTAGLDVDVRIGNLFEPIATERFAVMIVNPPYEVGASRPWARATVRSPDFLTRCAEQWQNHADALLVAFPSDEEHVLAACGFALTRWRVVETQGRSLGIYVG